MLAAEVLSVADHEALADIAVFTWAAEKQQREMGLKVEAGLLTRLMMSSWLERCALQFLQP